VVVAHSKGDVPGNQPYSSMSQIASCNYVARQVITPLNFVINMELSALLIVFIIVNRIV